MGRWLKRHWFLVTLAAVVVLGFLAPLPLQVAAQWTGLQNGIVFVVMFLMALPIEARAFGRSIRRPAAPLLAIAMSYLFQPLACWPLSLCFPVDIGHGLFVAAIIPCTLASAAVWTRRAGGNDAIALVVTVVTNASCFVVAPLWLWLVLGANDDAARWLSLVPKLALLVVAPMVLAQWLRRSSVIAVASTRHKVPLSVAAQVGILAMVLLGIARIATRVNELSATSSPGIWSGMIAAVIGLHVATLLLGLFLAVRLRLPAADATAVAIAGSQKTLMVGLSVAIDLGWSILPLVVYHVSQLFIDTWIADHWLKPFVERSKQDEKSVQAESRTD